MLHLLFNNRLRRVLYRFGAAFACHAGTQHCNQLRAGFLFLFTQQSNRTEMQPGLKGLSGAKDLTSE